MRRFIRIVLRYALLWVLFTIGAVWWVAERGDMSIREALPTGIFGGIVLTIAVVATLRKMRRRRTPS